MEKIRKPTKNVFRLLFLFLGIVILIFCAFCLYSYSYCYFYGVPKQSHHNNEDKSHQSTTRSSSSPSPNYNNGKNRNTGREEGNVRSTESYPEDNVTFVDYLEYEDSHSDFSLIHHNHGAHSGQSRNGAGTPTTTSRQGRMDTAENRLLETIRRQNMAKLKRELIYIYKLPPPRDEDYEEELKVESQNQNENSPGEEVWFFDDLDTDTEDYLTGEKSFKGVPHRFTSPTIIATHPGSSSSNSAFGRSVPTFNGKDDSQQNVNHNHQHHNSRHSHHSRFDRTHLINVATDSKTNKPPLPTNVYASSKHMLDQQPQPFPSNIIRVGVVGTKETTDTSFPRTLDSHSQTNHKANSDEVTGHGHPSSKDYLSRSAGVDENINNNFNSSKKAKYYNTGHFRKSHAIIWDPHPQYIFHAFGHRFHLMLNLIPQRHSFLTPQFTVTTHHSHSSPTHSNNESVIWRENLQEQISGCFYNGFVLGDPNSSVAVSLCHGMTGHIRTSHGSYFIEPLPHNSEEQMAHQLNQTIETDNETAKERQILHEIYQVGLDLSKESSTSKKNKGDSSSEDYSYDQSEDNLKIGTSLYDDDEDDYWLNPGMTTPPPKPKKRTKRSMSKERYVELSVVTDESMSNYHGDNLKHYVLTLLTIVALIYKDASIGNPVNIALVSFHVLPDKSFATNKWTAENATSSEFLPGISASEMLRNFCKWQKEHNNLDDKSPHHHDMALLLTRETICRNPWLHKCDTLGLAELGTMCDHYASCAIVQDNGLSAAFTIAHELGHVMNMPHDDDYKCQSFLDSQSSHPATSNHLFHHQFTSDSPHSAKEPQHYVMSRMLDHNTYPWAWSRCSRHFLTEFLDAGHGYCLEDKPGSHLIIGDLDNPDSSNLVDNYTSPQQPGEIFSEHKQCELVFGPSSHLCSYMPPCRRLWCTTGTSTEEQEGCRTQHMPWADGTPCGSNKWCQRGACVMRDLEKLKTVNGGWATWMDYGECSRTCGGGVRKSYRECDNPRPSNGGKYCIGPRVRYESCNTHECPNEADYRAEQCAHFNNDNFNIQGLPKDITWVPKYHGISPKDRCKLFCRVQGSSSYYLLREKVVDGTTCGIDTFDVCVNGACLPAGCDRRLHSNKVLDICGVCGGDGSTCRTTRGSFNESQYGYNSVIRIPAGASNIDIRQRSFDDTARDDNYLALIDSNDEYLLNGNFTVSMFRKTLHYGGSILEYSGSHEVVERINSSSRPIKSDLILQVLSVGKLHPPDINYQYVISLNYNANTGSRSSSNAMDARWTFTERWKTCTEICQGTQSRIQICSNTRTNTEISSEYCRNIAQLSEQKRFCNAHCVLKWVRHQKTCDCLAPNRTEVGFKCIRETPANKTYISEGYCSKFDKPQAIPDCSEECSRPKWRWTQWSECSTRCGDGLQMRNVWCQRYNMRQPESSSNSNQEQESYMVLPDLECAGVKPSNRRNCSNGACGQWRIDQWSPCSSSCGSGISRAAHACYLEDAILPSDYCLNQPKPAVERSCDADIPCVAWAIKISEEDEFVMDFDDESYWSECTTPCSPTTGYQARPLVCMIKPNTRKNQPKAKQVSENICTRLLSNKPMFKRVCPNVIPSHCYINSRLQNPKRSYYDHVSTNSNQNSIETSNAIDDPVMSLPLVGDNSIDDEVEKESTEWIIGKWGECYKSGDNYIIVRDVSCSKSRCREARPSNSKACGMWYTGEWERCNSTCEIRLGFETREVKCVPRNGDGSIVLDLADCSKPMPETSRSCTKYCKPKGKWRTGPWGKCSRPCGVVQDGFPNVTRGQRIRQVACFDELRTSTLLPESECDIRIKPDLMSSCTDTDSMPCPVWSTSEWSECMATTTTAATNTATNIDSGNDKNPRKLKSGKTKSGDACSNDINQEIYGHRERIVKCHDHNGQEIPEYHCLLLNKKPDHSEVCTLSRKNCALHAHYRWRIGTWSKCSKNCGTKGVKTRSVECTKVGVQGKINTTLVAEDKFCQRGGKKRKPKNERGCARYHCPYKWVTTEWSECSRACGYGIQHRQVTCHRVNKLGWVDPDPVNGCGNIEKPKEYNYCILSESCDNSTISYKWTTERWSECPSLSQTCSAYGNKEKKDFQKRRVYCTMNGQRTAQRHCEKLSPKPIRKKKCLKIPCGYMSCEAVKLGGNYIDGEYQLLVAGMNVSIYCHGLNSEVPHEYLTLLEENFSEIYDKRLIRPETCPRNGKRLDSCECIQDRNRRSGLTTWSKIRVNVTNLRVDADDFTYAKSTGDLIPYGTSGDCYSSSMNCPQGRFSIDLRRTNLAVNSFTTWVSQGHKPNMQITKASDNQKVEGKCGGYCGTCSPNRLNGLKLEIALQSPDA